MKTVIVDNFDSFTFNLVDEFERRECQVEVWRNNAGAEHILERARSSSGASLIVLSPGPGSPSSAGCCLDLVRLAAGSVPLLGVCLGHQALVQAFGGEIAEAGSILHGRSSHVTHKGDRLFDGLASPFVVGRYHSLVGTSLPQEIVPLAWADSVVMAVRHRRFPLFGLQFHPESILTPQGGQLIDNVLRLAAEESA